MSDRVHSEATVRHRRRRCFVTVGATASFNSLIKAVLQPAFLQSLNKAQYTELRIQYGKDGKTTFDDQIWLLEPTNLLQKYSLSVTGFDFDKNGLNNEMRAAKGDAVQGLEQGVDGCVVSHAGSGSILDALRIGVSLLVVPNNELMDNHQVELAEVLEQEGYVVHGKLDNLAEAIQQVEQLRQLHVQWPPVNSKDRRGGLKSVIREEMGWLD